MNNQWLCDFVRESNRIEGIRRDPTKEELAATKAFLNLPEVRITDLKNLVSVYAPGAELRMRPGMDVRVGSHRPPPGGPRIEVELQAIVGSANNIDHPYQVHHAYETLHPFMDGNGRSGRALWAWQMMRTQTPLTRLGFLHAWYYQSLEAAR